MMALIISDANIIIDLECAGLTGRIFRLEMERLHESRLITLREMAEAYEVMLDSQHRLPAAEIRQQLTRLRRA